jgi:WD40 repeat protein
LGNENGAEQLSDFKNPDTKISSLKISPDGKRLLYYRDKQLELLNTRDGKIESFTDLNSVRQVSKIIWGSDSNSLIYFDNTIDLHVKKYDLVTQQHSIVATLETIKLFSNDKGIPFAVTKQGIVDLSTEKVYPFPENFKITPYVNFAQVGKYFYATEGLNSSLIYRWQTNDQTADVADFNEVIINMIVTDKHEIVLITRKRLNTKIERLSWQPLESSN